MLPHPRAGLTAPQGAVVFLAVASLASASWDVLVSDRLKALATARFRPERPAVPIGMHAWAEGCNEGHRGPAGLTERLARKGPSRDGQGLRGSVIHPLSADSRIDRVDGRLLRLRRSRFCLRAAEISQQSADSAPTSPRAASSGPQGRDHATMRPATQASCQRVPPARISPEPLPARPVRRRGPDRSGRTRRCRGPGSSRTGSSCRPGTAGGSPRRSRTRAPRGSRS